MMEVTGAALEQASELVTTSSRSAKVNRNTVPDLLEEILGSVQGNFLKNISPKKMRLGEYPRVCVWGLAHAVKTGHLLNRSG